MQTPAPSPTPDPGFLGELAALPWGTLTPGGALLIVLLVLFRMLSTGALITRSSHEREIGLIREIADHNKNVASTFQTALDKEVARGAEQAEQIKTLLDSSRLINDSIRALRQELRE